MAQVISPIEASTTILENSNYRPTFNEIMGKIKSVWWSPFALVVLIAAIVAVVIGYQFHPPLEIKMGSGYDAPFLNLAEQHGFGDEVRLVSSADQADITDASSQTVTDTTDVCRDPNPAFQPADAKTLKPLPEPVVGNYRWALQRPIVLLPGTGSYPATLTLTLAGSPIFQSQHIDMLLNGVPFTSFDIKPGTPQIETFGVTADKFSGGNLAVELRATNIGAANKNIIIPAEACNTARYGDSQGFKFYDLKLAAQTTGFSLPPLTPLIFLTLSALLLYFSFGYLGLALRWSALGVVGLLAIAATILATYRLELTDYVSRLALLTLATAIALPVLEWLIPRLWQAWKMPLPQKTFGILLICFAVGLLLRGGGVLYPQTVIIDSPAHLQEINKILHGQLVQEYFNKDLSKVPGQWDSTSLIPYSTISYFLLAPFGGVGDPAIGVNLFNALLDALRIFVIFGLALKLGTGLRAATAAAVLYLLTPATWLLNSWGNWPTTVSLWLGVLYLFLLLVYADKLQKRGVFIGLTLLLTLTMITYIVTAVFVGLMVLIYVAGLFFFVGRKQPQTRRNALTIFGSLVAASLLSVATYYWQFVGDTINTLTNFSKQVSNGQTLGLQPRTLTYYYGLYTDHIFNMYGAGAILTLALAVYGFSLFAPPRLFAKTEFSAVEPDWTTLRSNSSRWFVGSWFVVFVIFGFVGWKMDMVDKQVWFVVPISVVLSGVALVFLWQKLREPILRYGGRAVVAGCVFWLTYSSVTLWIYRLAFKRH